MDTLPRDPEPHDTDEVPRDRPTGALTVEAPPAGSGKQMPTYLHPIVLIAAAAGYSWALLVFWVVFAGYGYMGLAMGFATLISLAMLGLMAGGGVAERDVTPWERPWRSFREFLASEVEVWDARISGRDAFVQLAGMAWCLAALAPAFGIIVAVVRTT